MSEFKRDPRGYALELVESGAVDAVTMLTAALGYMSCDDVRDMLDANELSPRYMSCDDVRDMLDALELSPRFTEENDDDEEESDDE